MERNMLCFSKIDKKRRQQRRYSLWMQRDLFSGWSVMAAWGPLGAAGGKQACLARGLSLSQAARTLVQWAAHRIKRGYLLAGKGCALGKGSGVGLASAAGASMSTCKGDALGKGVAVPLGWSSGQAVIQMAIKAEAQVRTNKFMGLSVRELQSNASGQQV